MKITTDALNLMKTKRGGWKKETLSLLGITWPPVKGWKRRLIGKEITQDLFELLCDTSTTQRDLPSQNVPAPHKIINTVIRDDETYISMTDHFKIIIPLLSRIKELERK